MLFRRIGTAAVLTAGLTAAAVGIATSSHAALAPTTAIQTRDLADNDAAISLGTSVGTCNFLASGPSTSPYYTPFHIEGQATTVSTRLVASTKLTCQLRTYSGSVLGSVTRNAPGYASAVAQSFNVSSYGPFQICTMVNVYFENGQESNPNQYFACQAMHGILG